MRIQLNNISKSYPTPSEPLEILKNISITFEEGTTTAILGPSGSGKSTLLNIVGTLDAPTSGQVNIHANDATIDPFSLKASALAAFRATHIGFIFQEHFLLPQLTALENILLPSLARVRRGADDVRRAEWLLNRVGLEQRSGHLPAQLSGGERQRVAIARGLMNQPSLILADEPTGNLDSSTAESIMNLLLSISQESGTTLIAVTHNPDLSKRFGRALTMHNGTLI